MVTDIARLLARELEAFEREIAAFPDDESLWRTLPGVANSAGNLGLHVAGNLQHFVGTVLGGTGYVRNRDAEFSRRSGTREQVREELAAAREVVQSTLPGVEARRLSEVVPGLPNGLQVRMDIWLMHLVAHAAFHLGQAGYLRRIATGDTQSTNPIPLSPLVG
jgi:uncharacterized damage-inducible protein DinB